MSSPPPRGVVHIAWLQLFRRVPGNEIFSELDWGILVLFASLFVLVGSLDGTWLVDALHGIGGGWEVALGTFVLSNLVSNVPAVVLLSTTVNDPTGWYLLAGVSTLTNATPIASAATLIVLDQARRSRLGAAPRSSRVPHRTRQNGVATTMLLW